MSREELMEAWTRVDAVRKGAATAAVAMATTRPDPALEREQLEFERQKFHQEMKMREAEMAMLS